MGWRLNPTRTRTKHLIREPFNAWFAGEGWRWTIFAKKEWIDETLSVIDGNDGELHVSIRSFPCRREKHGDRRQYRYRNFAHDFITELTERQLPDFETIASKLDKGQAISASVGVGWLPDMLVERQGRPHPRRHQFFSDLADAIVDAFDKNGIRP